MSGNPFRFINKKVADVVEGGVQRNAKVGGTRHDRHEDQHRVCINLWCLWYAFVKNFAWIHKIMKEMVRVVSVWTELS